MPRISHAYLVSLYRIAGNFRGSKYSWFSNIGQSWFIFSWLLLALQVKVGKVAPELLLMYICRSLICMQRLLDERGSFWYPDEVGTPAVRIIKAQLQYYNVHAVRVCILKRYVS